MVKCTECEYYHKGRKNKRFSEVDRCEQYNSLLFDLKKNCKYGKIKSK